MLLAKKFEFVIRCIKAGQYEGARQLLANMQLHPGQVLAQQLMARLIHDIDKAQSQSMPANVGGALLNSGATGTKNELRLPGGRPLPRISIVTPSYNQGAYIEETIRSVQAQAYPNLEHILIDGGSTDETMNVVNRYRSHFACVISEKDRGQSDAINKGFSRSTGDILCWLNSDDQLAPGALLAVALAFELDTPDIVAGVCEVFKDGQLAHRHLTSCPDGVLPLDDLLDLDNGWNSGQFFYQPEVFFSRKLWDRAGGYVREDCYYSMDYELWCRFALAGAKLKVIGTPLAWFRSHAEQKTAVEARFKSELVVVRDRFVKDHYPQYRHRLPKAIDWSRRPRIAFVNDLGARYGAGIAHARTGAAMQVAGCAVELLAVDRYVQDGQCDLPGLLAGIATFGPDLVVFGNMHAIGQDAIKVVTELCKRYPTAWLAHDFWLITGRCAYFGACDKYLSACDSQCPTADQYPSLEPVQITSAHQAKRDLLQSSYRPLLWANSGWTQRLLGNAVAMTAEAEPVLPGLIRLAVPHDPLGRISRQKARHDLDIPPTDFVVLFSASSLSDERKGVGILLQALENIRSTRLRLLVLGNSDIAIDTLHHEVTQFGYVTDADFLATVFAAADVFVGPSQEETFGQVFVEAALCGTPSIAFDQSGMVDAVIHGVTGLRVPSSPQALSEAILELEQDVDKRRLMGFWAPIWAKANHSLEASYRSVHHALQAMGIADRLSLPKRLALNGTATLHLDTESASRSWFAVEGVSGQEKPVPPTFLTPFNWCMGRISRFRVRTPEYVPICIELLILNPLIDEQEITVEVNGENVLKRVLSRTRTPNPIRLEFEAISDKPWLLVTLHASKCCEPTHSESRRLSLVIQDIRVSESMDEC